jgi:hypothetical protein
MVLIQFRLLGMGRISKSDETSYYKLLQYIVFKKLYGLGIVPHNLR